MNKLKGPVGKSGQPGVTGVLDKKLDLLNKLINQYNYTLEEVTLNTSIFSNDSYKVKNDRRSPYLVFIYMGRNFVMDNISDYLNIIKELRTERLDDIIKNL